MKVLIIIPAYNESQNIEKVVGNIIENYPEYDYLVVNDCSSDNTEFICKNGKFNYISLPVNLGIGGGVQAGYIYARNNNYDVAVQIDGDGQHNPKYIDEMIKLIEMDEADIVIGSRFINYEGFQSSTTRRIGINFLSKLIKLCSGVEIKDVTSGYRAVNKRYISIYSSNYAQDYPEPEAIIFGAFNNAKIKEVPVKMNERKAGTSSINAWRPIYYMIKVSLSIILYRLTLGKRGK